jgi:hypothetical protein
LHPGYDPLGVKVLDEAQFLDQLKAYGIEA